MPLRTLSDSIFPRVRDKSLLMDKNIRKRSSQCRLHRSLTAPTSFEEELQKPKNRAPLWFLSLSVQMGGFVVAQTDRLAIPRVRVKAEFVDFVGF